MTDPKKSDKLSPAAGAPSAMPAPQEAQELIDADLDSVIGGAAAIDSLAIDDYGAGDMLVS
jgi:hypothetical protein